MEDVLDLYLVRMHFVVRRTLLSDEHAEGEGTVADGEEGLRDDIEKIAGSQQTNHPNRQGNPAIPKEKPQRAPIDG